MSDYNTFINTRPLSWWRAYVQGAYHVYEGLLKRPLNASDKRLLWKRLKRNCRTGGVGSYTALAIMTNAFERREP